MNSEHTYYLISDVNTIYEVDYQTDVIHRSYNGHHGVVLCLRYSPDGTSFISGSDDSSIRLWTVDLYVVSPVGGRVVCPGQQERHSCRDGKCRLFGKTVERGDGRTAARVPGETYCEGGVHQPGAHCPFLSPLGFFIGRIWWKVEGGEYLFHFHLRSRAYLRLPRRSGLFAVLPSA